MNLLFIGDIVGKGGRQAVKELVPELRQEHNCCFVIANGENMASGAGISRKCIEDINDHVDVITTGDHVWDQKNFENEIKAFPQVIRPANYSKQQPGKGYGIFRNPAGGDLAVINVTGKIFIRESAYCPFEKIDEILAKLPKTVKGIVVDIHAEATSEKAALAHYLDGRVTAVLGTHTHVQTADAKVLPRGTAFISDVGMVGGESSILGREIPAVIRKISTGIPCRLPVVETGIRFDAVVVSYDHNSGKATEIKPISIMSSV